MAAVSISMGVMQPLLEKLATLMGDEYKKLKGLRKEVSFLKRELSDMNAVLEKMDDADELDPQAKNWRKDIIEMSYDIENYIDNFMDRVGEADNNVGALRKASNYLRTFKDRRRLANQFQDIKTLVIEAGERRKRYMLDQCVSSTTHVTVDPRLSSLYQKSANLVGIDIQKEEIVRWIIDGGQQLKVMSIVGFGGLGKTTLANEVYREVDGKFSHKAFVSISQKPDIIKLLNSLILQLGLQPYSHPCEPQDLINNIIKHLQDKRWIDHLCYLCELLLCAKQMHQEDMNMIGTKLTSLVSLVLRISGVPRERIVIGGSTGFKDLKRFELDCDGSPCMAFEEGAMPDLQELELAIALEKWDKGTPTGLQHLPSLKRIKVCTAKTGDAVTTKQMSATAALMRGLFQKATDALPSRSTVNIDNAWSWIRQMKAFRSSTNDPRQQFQAQAQAMLIAQAQDHYTVEPSWRRKLS